MHETAEQWKGVDLCLQLTICEACRVQSCLADSARTVQSHSPVPNCADLKPNQLNFEPEHG
jgi:CO dehydrogenase/acetyl-CoA synthase gamma subunit (corrinoid Fe-S protein)